MTVSGHAGGDDGLDGPDDPGGPGDPGGLGGPDDGGAGALLHAWILDGEGGARGVGVSSIAAWRPDQGVLWVHVNFQHPDVLALLGQVPGLDRRQAGLLATDDSRPSTEVSNDAVRVTLRGVNLHPEADPEDMVSLRLWAMRGRIVSARRRHLLSIEDIVAAHAVGNGPRTPGAFLAAIAARLTERMQGTVDQLDARVLAMEDTMADKPDASLRHDIAVIRRATIMLKRYLAPQRDALAHLATASLSWFAEEERLAVRDALDGLQRHLEDLDSVRERATVVREELANHAASLTNARMYLLSLLSAVFLPLGFVTGLLGVNVGGIPGADNAHGFLFASIALGLVAVVIVLLFRFRRWL